MTNRTYAAIDLGSNSCRLLIVDAAGNQLCSKTFSTRLAEGMSRENMITKEAFERGQSCFFECRQLLDKYDVAPQNVRAVATAACRTAKNGIEFVRRMYDESRIQLEIIDGLEEAELNLKGALEHVLGKSEYVVIYDLGGASTEITLATNTENPEIVYSVSIPWGARNASESFELIEYQQSNARRLEKEIDRYIDTFLQHAELDKHQDICFVATSSTPLRLASMVKKFGVYDREKSDGQVLSADDMTAAIESILHAKREDLADNPYIGDKRSFIFIAACIIFRRIYQRLGLTKLTASLKSAKDGIVASLIERDKNG